MNKLVSGAIALEIAVPSGVQTGLKLNLPNDLNLKGKRIKHIDVCIATGTTPKGNEPFGNEFSLTLMEFNTSKEKVNNLDAKLLDLAVNKGNRLFVNKIVDLPLSYITITSTNAIPANACVYLLFWYDEPMTWNEVRENDRECIESFEVLINNLQNNTYKFDTNRAYTTLHNRKVKNLLLNIPDKSPLRKTAIPTVENAFVTLVKNNVEFFKGVPLFLFQQNASVFPLRLQNILFDWTNSYIEFTDKTGFNTDMSVFFNVIIDDTK